MKPCEMLYQYFTSDLPEKEVEQFELHLFDCEKCRTELDQLQTAFHVLREDAAGAPKTAVRKKPVSVKWTNRRALALAVSLFIVALLARIYLDKPPHYEQALLTDALAVDVLKTGGTSSPFEVGLDNLRQRRFDEAVAAFETALEQSPESFQAHYYLGVAYLAKGEPKWWQRKAFSESETAAAIATLQHALALAGDNPFYRENCHWLLAKARLRQQQISLAISHWQAIVDLPAADLTYRSKARELVSRYQTTR